MITDSEIEVKTSELLRDAGALGKFPVPVDDIAEYLGFKCYFFNPKDEKSKSISGAVDHINKKIFVNNSDTIKRQFFTIAHEIGHIILNGKDCNYIDYRGVSCGPKEDAADMFAACLLMPRDIFTYQFKILNGNFDALSRFFACSNQAVYLRVKKLNMV